MDNEKLSSLTSIDDIGFKMPAADNADNLTPEIIKLLDNTDPAHIFLSSDWHFFKNHYKHEANYVNTQKIVKWCKDHLTEDDVFLYLGDISFRYANDEDKAESAKIMRSIPGRKVLIIGNHDEFCGQEYFADCGFEYALHELRWQNILFTHRPVKMDIYPEEVLNIHGHIHNLKIYNTTDGKRNINVYPMFYDNKPATLKYILSHKDQLIKNNTWNNNVGLGEQSLNFNEAYYIGGTKPKVYYSKEISPKAITYMAYLFKDHLEGNVAIKLHVGEEGNQNALPVRLIKPLRDAIKGTYVDSNVAYKSKRSTTEGHLEVAEAHGYDGLDVLDADGDFSIAIPTVNRVKKELERFAAEKPNYIPQCSLGPHLEKVHIGEHIKNYDSMIVYSHFKGHGMAGYGGAINNIGMGIPSGKRGKIEVHGKDFMSGPDFIERLVESAGAIADYFHGKIIYINVLKNMSVDCDCDTVAHDPTIPDIGVLVSDDIIAIEQASMDLIRNCQHNKDLMQRISDKGGYHQIEYGNWLGLGSRDYDLYSLGGERLKLEHGFVKDIQNSRGYVAPVLEGESIHETKRSELPDSAFGLPDERKYPLDTAQHVRSAIRLFGHCPEAKKKQLAKRIARAAKRYGISIPETTQVYKYLHEATFLESEGPVGGIEPVSTSMMPATVKNIVFDIGSVLADAKTVETLQRNPDIPNELVPAIVEFVTKKLFYRTKLDEDVKKYNILQIREYFDRTAPVEIQPYKDAIFGSFAPAMFYYDYTFELIQVLKQRGYSVYYLSNWDFYSYQLESTFFSRLINAMDGGLFSFETDYEKPDPEFFKIFLEKYNLDPASCAFFDDRVDNVEVARSLGFNAYLFDNQSTYLDLMGHEDMKDDNKTMLIVDNTAGFDILNVNDVPQWYIGTRNPNDIEPDSACKFGKLSDCVNSYIKSESLPNDANGDAPTEYVTLQAWALMNPELRDDDVTDTRRKWISAGVIEIDIHNGNYKWVYQTPLRRVDGVVYDVSGFNTSLSEWAMAACNPIQGIRKPFILKVGCDTGGIINTKQYAFSPDLINDKYLAISEEGVLEFVDSSEYDDCTVEEYEYVGDSSKLSKIYEAYSTGQIVDNTFFYTALTGKPMLTEDQIDFDSNFRKVDFELMRQKRLSTQATFESARNISLGGATYMHPINEDAISRDIPYLKKYSIIDELYVQRDHEGYYFFNSLNNKRSGSVDSISMLTEAMIRSIL